MTLHFNYDGVGDLGTAAVRLPMPPITERANMLDAGSSSITVDDPTAARLLAGLKIFWIQETDCSEDVLFFGRVTERPVQRGDGERSSLRVDGDRQWEVNIVDENEIAWRRVFKYGDGNRPAETDVQRVQWAVEALGHFDDLGLVETSNPVNMDATDYRGRYPGDLLLDCANASGKNVWVYRSSDNTTDALAYVAATSTAYTSTLRFTNVPADVDNVTTFDAQGVLVRDPQNVYGGVFVKYANGFVYENNATTIAAFGGRDASIDEPDIKTESAARARALQFLAQSAAEEDTITVTAEVPSSVVNLVRAGHRVQVKFSHLPGYSSGYTYIRCLTRTVEQLPYGSHQVYKLTLELKNPRAATPSGGGSPSTTPTPPFTPPTTGGTTGTLAGSTWITWYPPHVTASSPGDPAKAFIFRINRTGLITDAADNVPTTYAPNTDQATFTADSIAGDGTGVFIGSGAETPFNDIQYGVRYYIVGEYVDSNGLGVGYSDGATPIVFSPGAHTGYAGPPAGYTLTARAEAGGSGGPGTSMLIGSFIITPDSPTSTPGTFPQDGQPIAGSEVIGNGDGTTTTFHTAYPYQPGSLQVYVDGFLQNATETDPSTGTFTLPFAPFGGEVPELITATYSGAGTPPVIVPYVPSTAACTATYTGDSTGATDVTSDLMAFIDRQPDGSVICFATGGTYKINSQWRISGRNNLHFKGSGTTFHQTVRGTDTICRVIGGSNISFEGITIQGANPSPGVWNLTYEHNHAWAIWGTVGMDFNGCGVLNVGGDGLYFTNNGSGVWSNTINFHDGVINGTGRMGIAVTDGARNIIIEDNTIENIGYYTFDIEPNGHVYGGIAAGGANIIVRNNTMGPSPYAASGVTPYVFAVTGSSGGGPADGVEFSGNTITGVMWVGVFNNGGIRRNIVVTNNTASATATAGPHSAVMVYQGVNTLTVTHNTQAVSGVSLISDTGGSGTHVTSPNP